METVAPGDRLPIDRHHADEATLVGSQREAKVHGARDPGCQSGDGGHERENERGDIAPSESHGRTVPEATRAAVTGYPPTALPVFRDGRGPRHPSSSDPKEEPMQTIRATLVATLPFLALALIVAVLSVVIGPPR